MDNIESQEVVNNEVQDSTPEPQSVEASESTNPQVQPEAAKADEQHVPYSRFKELVEEKNSYAEKMREHELAMAKLQAQLELLQPKQQGPQKPQILEELKQVHPEFAALLEETYGYKDKLAAAQKELEEIKGWRQSQERQSLQSRYNAALEEAAKAHNVPEELRDFVRRQVDAEARSNPKMRLEDVSAVYKAQFEQISKLFQERERKLRESYVAAKSKDAQVPATKKGAPAGPTKEQFSSDPAEARSQIVKRALTQFKAAKNI